MIICDRILRLSLVLLLTLVGISSGAADNDAAGTQPTASRDLRDGLELERKGRWNEAVRHYESAVRRHADSTDLEQRLLVSRIHYDVNRRYQDSSFKKAVTTLSTQQALELYDEVLANIETHYVDPPRWDRLQRHGTAFLEVALTESPFLDHNTTTASAEEVEEFRLQVHRYVGQRTASSRFELRANAAYAAGLAHQRLGLSGTATVLEYVCGAIGLLDPYSRFLTGQQLDETFSNIEGNFVGLGIELKAEEDRLRIVSVIPGGPADEGGIVAGDAIVSVDAARTDDVSPDAAADLLTGADGSWVTVGLVAEDGTQREARLQRRRVDVPCVENSYLADAERGIAYLRLTNFQKTTLRDLDRALWKLHRDGMQSLIIDLRGNPGGLLTAAVEAADRFIDSGRIVTTRGRNTRENFEYVAHRPGTWNVPLILLIDHDSASASEIFAGAIRDSGRGQIVGTTSYGKGSVQGIFRLDAAHMGLCLTTAKFYSPSGNSINEHGVEPDIVAESPRTVAKAATEAAQDAAGAAATEDAALTKAIEVARQQVRLSQRQP